MVVRGYSGGVSFFFFAKKYQGTLKRESHPKGGFRGLIIIIFKLLLLLLLLLK
jgi:hypothetical protein